MSSIIKVEPTGPPDCVEIEILFSPDTSIKSDDEAEKTIVEQNEKSIPKQNEETSSITKKVPTVGATTDDSAEVSKQMMLTSESVSPFTIKPEDERMVEPNAKKEKTAAYSNFKFEVEDVFRDYVVTSNDKHALMPMISGSTSDPFFIKVKTENDAIFEPAERKENISPLIVKTEPAEIVISETFKIPTKHVGIPISESISSVSINSTDDTAFKLNKEKLSSIAKTEQAEILVDHSTQISTKPAVAMSISDSISPVSITSETDDTIKNPIFELNEKVLSFHGPLLYDAKILHRRTVSQDSTLSFKGNFEYYVHFLGWKKRHDTWISEILLLKHTPGNVEIQKRTELAIREAASAATKKSTSSKKKRSSKTAESFATADGTNKNTDDETKTGTTVGASQAVVQDLDTKDKRLLRSLMQSVESLTSYQNTPQIQIPMPMNLRQVLFDDWVLIVQKQQLLDLPAHVSVDKILNDFFVSRGDIEGSAEDQFTSEIDKMFKEEIQYLFYPPERIQFDFVSECQKDIYDALPDGDEITEDVTSVYGLVHLLRMISILGEIVAFSPLEVENVERLMLHMSDFLKFLEENVELYFDPKQYTLSPEDYDCASDFINEPASLQQKSSESEI